MSQYREDMLAESMSILSLGSKISEQSQELYSYILSKDLVGSMSCVARIAKLSMDIDLHTVKLMEHLSLDNSETNTESRKHVAMWAIRIRSSGDIEEATRLLQSFAIQMMEASLNRTIDLLTNIVGVTPPEDA